MIFGGFIKIRTNNHQNLHQHLKISVHHPHPQIYLQIHQLVHHLGTQTSTNLPFCHQDYHKMDQNPLVRFMMVTFFLFCLLLHGLTRSHFEIVKSLLVWAKSLLV